MHPYLSAALGGMLIGLASWLLLAGLGRVAGISGITCSALHERGWHAYWRWAFLLGLIAGGALFAQWLPVPELPARAPLLIVGAGLLVAWAAGLLFALGLLLSGMAQPAKVIGFLNLAGMAQGEFPGAWDPSLAFVMGGAIMVTLLAFWLTPANPSHPQRKPWFSGQFVLPQQERIDAALLQGAVIFGVGWGLAGYCPGPALATLLIGGQDIWLFVPAMLAGMWLARRTLR